MSETDTTPKLRKKVEQATEPVPRQKVVVHLPRSELHPMPDAPYGVRDDEAMRASARSIKENGVLTPAIVHPRADSGYEIIAGNGAPPCPASSVNWTIMKPSLHYELS